ncbi:MAG: hypothetical protein JNL60_11035 [Bacteroidia bacterium]|nr:hypothetical protein [Bacteroidia bacterium]
MKKLLLYSIALCVLFSCKKKELPNEEYTERVFYINCDIDGQANKLEAGNNNYYMNTSCGKDSDVYYFQGDLTQTTYSNGRDYAISVIISDDKASAAATPVDVDHVLLTGDHLYNTKLIPEKTQLVTFTPEKPDDGSEFFWKITDGKSDTRTFKAYSVTGSFDVAKTYSATLSYTNSQGSCDTNHDNIFRIGNKLQTNITASRLVLGSDVRYTLDYLPPVGLGPYTCKWTFEDASIETTKVAVKTFQADNLRTTVKLELFDAFGDTCVTYYQLHKTTGQLCHANYVANFQPVKNISIFPTVKIILTDKDGKTYTSSIVQPETSYFQIQNSEPYKVNDKGQATRSVKIKFNCLVGDGSKTIAISNAEGVIAVAHQ